MKSVSPEDLEWNLALLAMGREWRKQMIHYAPEERHEVDKAIYALWRGKSDDEEHEDAAVCFAIDEGLRGT